MSILSIYYTYLGLIISGGYSKRGRPILTNTVEMFVPSTGQHCTLPDLNRQQTRYSHTMEEMVVCGGEEETSIECLTLTRTGWRTKARPLLERR